MSARETDKEREETIDETLADTFPASDPPAWTLGREPQIEKWLEGVPTVIVEDGRPLKDRMARARVDESDVLTAARHL